MSDQSADARTFTGWHMLGVLVAFFGVVIAVNLLLAYYANESWTGLITNDSYLAGQTHNEELQKAREQAARGFQAKLSATTSAVEFEFLDAKGAPVPAEKVEIRLGRPADDEDDHTIALDYVGAGRYRMSHGLAPGQWQADLTATLADGSDWRQKWRLYLPDEKGAGK